MRRGGAKGRALGAEVAGTWLVPGCYLARNGRARGDTCGTT